MSSLPPKSKETSKSVGTPKASSTQSTTDSAVPEEPTILNSVLSFFKKAAVVLSVWAFGHYNFSPSWLLILLVVVVLRERQQASKRRATVIAQQVARDEKATVLARMADLPSWVNFPDVERAEWVNKIVDQLWPFIGEYVRELLLNTVEGNIINNLPAALGSFKFSKIELGDIPPRIGGVKVYTNQVRRDEIYMDMEIIYASDCNLEVQVKGMNFGVKNLTVHGTLRIIFRPLINTVPLIGGISVFFLNNPDVDFDLTCLANALDLPGLRDILHSIVREQIAQFMVLPNRIPIQLADSVDITRIRYPQPQGILRVTVVEAQELVAADFGFISKGNSDPYTIVTVGVQSFQTKVVENSLNPVWDQTFEYVVDEREGQLLNLQVKDMDPASKDDSLGVATMDIATLIQKGTVDEWLPLENVNKGLVHLRVTWLYLADDPKELDRVQSGEADEDTMHSALLIVNLDSAANLPRGTRTLQEPSPMALLTLGQVTQESSVRAMTSDPRWEENFRFFVANPNHQSLDIEVRDSKTKKSVGTTTIRLKDLLSAQDMVLDQKFHLKTTEIHSSIYMTLILRILTPEANPRWMETWNSKKTGRRSKPSSPAEEDVPAGTEGNSSSSTTELIGTQGGEAGKSGSEVGSSDSSVRQRKPIQPSGEEDAGKFGLGRIQLSFRHGRDSGELFVTVHKILNLKPADEDDKGLANPYVKISLLPDEEGRETKVVKESLHPVFNEAFEYEVKSSELPTKSLEIKVKNDEGFFSSDQTMGMVLVDLSTLDTTRSTSVWLDIAPKENLQAVSLKQDL